MTLTDERPVRCPTGPCTTEPHTATELVEVLDTMRAVLGPPEAMDSPALMRPWARLALEAALRARPAPRRRR